MGEHLAARREPTAVPAISPGFPTGKVQRGPRTLNIGVVTLVSMPRPAVLGGGPTGGLPRELPQMTTDRYLWPPELTGLLIETIPRLCPSKDDVLLFFRSAGVHESILASHREALRRDRNSVRKKEMTREIMTRLLDGGERYLGELRRVQRQVEEFEDFSRCWPQDQLAAKGLVAEVRRVRNVKDSFTRLGQERDADDRRRLATREQEAVAAERRRDLIGVVRRDLNGLFSEKAPARRGKALEGVLNRYFEIEQVKVREAFTVAGEHGEGILDQVDGVITLDGELYLVEMKWTSDAVGVEEVSRHLTRVFGRGCARGIFISAAGYSEAARLECQRHLTKGVFILCELEELVRLVEQAGSLPGFLRTKVEAAVLDRQPLIRPLRAS